MRKYLVHSGYNLGVDILGKHVAQREVKLVLYALYGEIRQQREKKQQHGEQRKEKRERHGLGTVGDGFLEQVADKKVEHIENRHALKARQRNLLYQVQKFTHRPLVEQLAREFLEILHHAFLAFFQLFHPFHGLHHQANVQTFNMMRQCADRYVVHPALGVLQQRFGGDTA